MHLSGFPSDPEAWESGAGWGGPQRAAGARAVRPTWVRSGARHEANTSKGSQSGRFKNGDTWLPIILYLRNCFKLSCECAIVICRKLV